MLLSSILYSPGKVPTLIKSLSLLKQLVMTWKNTQLYWMAFIQWPWTSRQCSAQISNPTSFRFSKSTAFPFLFSKLQRSNLSLWSSFFLCHQRQFLLAPNSKSVHSAFLSPLYKNYVLQLFHILLYHWFPSLLDQIISISRHAMLSPPKRKNPSLSPLTNESFICFPL